MSFLPKIMLEYRVWVKFTVMIRDRVRVIATL